MASASSSAASPVVDEDRIDESAPVELSPDDKNMIKLLSDNGINGCEYQVPLSVLRMSSMIDTMICDLGADQAEVSEVIPVNVAANILELVIEWCTKHKGEPAPPEDELYTLAEWDRAFFNVDDQRLYDLIMAANFLDIKGMLMCGCKKLSELMYEQKTPEDMRRRFNIPYDFTPEQEAEIREELKWIEN